MSRFQDTGEVKALFRLLVKAAGGIEAAAVELGISFQRVSFYQSPSNIEEPPYRHIRALEAVVGTAIVTGSHVRAVQGAPEDCVKAAVVDTVAASAESLTAVHQMDADGYRDESEIRQVQQRAQASLAQAEEAADTAARLKPGPVA